jgi:AraC family transcriptional activator of tynA and feaB
MLQRDGVSGMPLLDFEAWRALLRSNCGGEVEVTAPNDFAGRMRSLTACGLEAASVGIQWTSVAGDLGCHDHRVERARRDVRRDGADHYLILFQVAGRSALTQIDQAVELAVGDVALVDAARPVTYLSRHRSAQWLSLRLPRKSVQSHLGIEPKVGLGRKGTRAGRLLFDLVRDAHAESAFSRADSYMQHTCTEFIYSLRLDRAAYLLHRRALLSSGQPLSEIAYACGFRDYAHFARKFRNRFGSPPGAHAGPGPGAGVRTHTSESARLTHDPEAPAS